MRGLVRSPEDTGTLVEAGVELVTGDVTNAGSMVRAAQGVQDIIHTAAVIGGTWSKSKPEDFWAVNYQGTINVLDAARAAGARRCVLYSSLAILDWSCTATNTSPILPITTADSNYTRAKRSGFYASMHRASLDRRDRRPAGIYGPAPLVERAIVPTSYTGTLLLALRGGLKQYVQMPASWAFVEDVVAISSQRGKIVILTFRGLPGAHPAAASARLFLLDVRLGGRAVFSAVFPAMHRRNSRAFGMR